MALETATYISDLVTTNPTHADTMGQTDSHLRLLKTVLKSTFPNITGAVTMTQGALNAAVATADRVTQLETNRVRNDSDQTINGSLNVYGTNKLKENGNALIPRGVIVAWAGLTTAIPGGWALCDGTNGTPNLVGLMIAGAGPGVPAFSTGGAVGVTATTTSAGSHSHGGGTAPGGAHLHAAYTDDQGAHTHGGITGGHVLTIGEMPAHDHALTGIGGQLIAYGVNPSLQAVSGSHMGGTTPISQGGNLAHSHSIPGDGLHAHTVNVSAAADHVHGVAADGGHTHTISISTMPPYMALGFIMKL